MVDRGDALIAERSTTLTSLFGQSRKNRQPSTLDNCLLQSGERGIRTPATSFPADWISNPVTESHNQQEPQQVTETANTVLPACLPESIGNDPDLVRVVDAWKTLPDLVKAGILALVNAAAE